MPHSVNSNVELPQFSPNEVGSYHSSGLSLSSSLPLSQHEAVQPLQTTLQHPSTLDSTRKAAILSPPSSLSRGAISKHQQDPKELRRRVCPFLEKGVCWYGAWGLEGGRCPNFHPEPCDKFLYYGEVLPQGCNNGVNCKYYHLPFFCPMSIKHLWCNIRNCKYLHHMACSNSETPPQPHPSHQTRTPKPAPSPSLHISQTSSQQTLEEGQPKNFMPLLPYYYPPPLPLLSHTTPPLIAPHLSSATQAPYPLPVILGHLPYQSTNTTLFHYPPPIVPSQQAIRAAQNPHPLPTPPPHQIINPTHVHHPLLTPEAALPQLQHTQVLAPTTLASIVEDFLRTARSAGNN